MMDMSFSSITAVAYKEFSVYLKTKRLLIMGGLYVAGFLTAIGIMSYYRQPNAFPDAMALAYSSTSIFYVMLPIALSYDLIAREQSRKSIFLLLSKPIRRIEVAIGKFIGIFSILFIVIVPIVTIGHIIAGISVGIHGIMIEVEAYAMLVVILLGMSCYISLSMLFSTLTDSTSTALILSLIVGWFGLSMLEPLVSLFYSLTGSGGGGTPLASKIAYLISPSNDMNTAMKILNDTVSAPVSVPQAVAALGIFLAITFAATLYLFRRKELT